MPAWTSWILIFTPGGPFSTRTTLEAGQADGRRDPAILCDLVGCEKTAHDQFLSSDFFGRHLGLTAPAVANVDAAAELAEMLLLKVLSGVARFFKDRGIREPSGLGRLLRQSARRRRRAVGACPR